jgi:hypothetical protein
VFLSFNYLLFIFLISFLEYRLNVTSFLSIKKKY